MTPVNQHDCKPSPGKVILADLNLKFPDSDKKRASQRIAWPTKAQQTAQMHSANEVAPGFKPATGFAADALRDMRKHLLRSGDFDRVNRLDACVLQGANRGKK